MTIVSGGRHRAAPRRRSCAASYRDDVSHRDGHNVANSPLAGKPAPKSLLIDPARLEREYYARKPDMDVASERVSFGTSGHRGSPLDGIVHRGAHPRDHAGDLRVPRGAGHRRAALHGQGHARPLRPGRSARRSKCWPPTASRRIIQRDDGFTPTPVISHAILAHNRGRRERLADGIVITPSHNPPEDGGFKYNPPNGGPADTDVTRGSRTRANELLRDGQRGRQAASAYAAALQARRPRICEDFVAPYVDDLRNVIDMDAIRDAGLKLGVDPLGGAAVHYWEPINATLRARHRRRELRRRSDLLLHDRRSRRQDPHGLLQPVRDGAPRRPQGPLSRRVRQRPRRRPARHRHAAAGLMNPNHYLAVAIRYLLTHRPHWPARCRGRQDAGQRAA